MTFDEVRDAIKNVEDMQLAHEIVIVFFSFFSNSPDKFAIKIFVFKAINPEFRLQPYQPPESSLEMRIKTIMHDAFWDLLREQLNADPPVYDHAISLLGDIKEVKHIQIQCSIFIFC